MVYDLAITFLRHGVTGENERKQYIGWSDVPLSENGVKLLKRAQNFQHLSAEVYVLSDLKRCLETYALLFPDSSVPLYTMEEWREMNFGEWEGRTYDELKDSPDYQRWLADFFFVAPPGGETFRQFQFRIEKGLTQLLELCSHHRVKHALVITHSGPIRYLLERYAPEAKGFWQWDVPFGSGYTLYNTKERWRKRKRCTSLSVVPFKENENGPNGFMG